MRVKGFRVDASLWEALRVGQRKSIETAFSYLTKREVNGSCLISLPTGAGKSGVITMLSHFSRQTRILVISHRRAVCEQLFNELNGDFFNRVAPGQEIKKKEVFRFSGHALTPGVHITTFQKLASLADADVDALKESVELLIVDEGHSEPSPVWSQITRGLDARKIIVTATPYRNDLFTFDVDPSSSYLYTFSEAVDEGVLEPPDFETVQSDAIVARVETILGQHPGVKCIVKCKRFEDIERYFAVFSNKFKTLAIHERYSGDDGEHKRASVPAKLKESDWQVIIHQKKLDEGVDIPQAKILVLTYNVANGRELVQTVGRIVRKHNGYPSRVMELDTAANSSMWENYRDFDSYLALPVNRRAFLDSLDMARLLKNYLSGFPDISYFESTFRKKFDLSTFDVKDSLTIPLASLCFVRKVAGFSLEATTDRMSWDATRVGELVEVRHEEFGMNVLLSVCFNNSKFLKEHLFFQPSLEVTILKDLGDFVAVFDSRGRDFSYEENLYLGAAIDINALLTLAARGSSTRTKETHAAAISTTRRRPERVSHKGQNLETIGAIQSNSAYALTTAKIDNVDESGEKHSSYYLGVRSGRVSDQMNRNFSLREMGTWLDDVAGVIREAPSRRSELLDSYAKPISEVPTVAPTSAVIDLSDQESPLYLKVGDNLVRLENSFHYCVYDDGFSFTPDHPSLKFQVQYDDQGLAVLSCDSAIAYSRDPERIEADEHESSLIELLNTVDLKVLYADGTSYFNGNFYQVTLPTHRGFRLEASTLGGLILALPDLLDEELTEKGEEAVDADEFCPKSIFFLIDRLKGIANATATVRELGPLFPHIPEVDLILCTDMGTEPADFILSSPTKLAFVHVKCGTSSQRPQSSAGALAEVGSQALKNLEMLNSSNHDLRPANWTNLLATWPSPTADRSLTERVRLFEGRRFENPDGDTDLRNEKLGLAWTKIAERRASPSVEKEIWIIAGNSFSRSHFGAALERGRDAAGESLQAYQLLDSWKSAAVNNDVALKFFVSP
jgi:hypothetical protein